MTETLKHIIHLRRQPKKELGSFHSTFKTLKKITRHTNLDETW